MASPSTGMSPSTNNGTTMPADWDDRELVEVVQLNIMKIVQFLGDFDRSVRSRLSQINERVTSLERSLRYCDAAIRSTRSIEVEEGAAGDDA